MRLDPEERIEALDDADAPEYDRIPSWAQRRLLIDLNQRILDELCDMKRMLKALLDDHKVQG